MSTPESSAPAPSSVSLYDARPFFEKALQHGITHGILTAEKLEAIRTDAPKGMVQIARHFGTEFLRPQLDLAKDRIVNLVSLYLEQTTNGDLQKAAESLRDHSFMSRSKGGSDMLRALIAMPDTSSFEERPQTGNELADWSLRTLADYRAELARRTAAQHKIDAALLLADHLDMDTDTLSGDANPEAKDAESVIRTALLVRASGRDKMPDWPAFEAMVMALRKKYGEPKTPVAGDKKPAAPVFRIPADLPTHLKADVEALRDSVIADLPKILDAAITPRALFAQMTARKTPPLLGRYFWIEDTLSEITHLDAAISKAWDKATGGHNDEGSLLTLLLCVAAGSPPKTLLTEKAAETLLKKIQKTKLKPELARDYLRDHAPVQYQDDYADLWDNFFEESQATLESDAAYSLNDAMALLRRECHIK